MFSSLFSSKASWRYSIVVLIPPPGCLYSGAVHVKCLYERGFPKMDHCPEGSWFCSESCTQVVIFIGSLAIHDSL